MRNMKTNNLIRTAVTALVLLVLVTATTAALDATITQVNGKVEIRERAGSPWIAAETGVVVPVGATISTSFNSSARLQLGDSTVEVKALTRMAIEDLVTQAGVDRTAINLPVGRISADVRSTSGKRAEFRVRSPIATASVRGTSFDFDGANLTVAQGVVLLANRFNEAVGVAAGEQSSAAGTAPPQPPASAAEDAGRVTITFGPGGGLPAIRSGTGGLTINWRIVN